MNYMKNILIKFLVFTIILSMMVVPAYGVEPTINVNVSQDNYVNVVLTVGDSSKDASTFEADLRQALSDLAGDSMPMDRLHIEAIETSVTSTNAADASAIFDNWTRYNDAGDWQYDASQSVIRKTTNAQWSGFYDPSFDSSDYTLELEMGAFGSDNDDIGITFGMKGFSTVLNYPNQRGYAYVFNGGEQRSWRTYDQTITSNSHPTGLYSMGQTYLTPLVDNYSDTFSNYNWYKFKLVVKDTNAKLYKDNNGTYNQIFDYTASESIDGTWGFFANSQPYATFKNVTMTSNSSKRFSEVIREPEWLDGSKRFIVNLEDGPVSDFEDPEALGEILARLGNDEIHYVGWGTGTNQVQAESFVAKNDNRGTFVNNTATNSIDDIAQYIYDEYIGSVVSDTDYVLYGKPSTITVDPLLAQTGTSDENWPQGKWKVDHDPDYYENPTGTVPYDGLYLDSLDISLNQTGEYKIYYEDNLVKTVYVHRMPVASYDVTAVSNGSGADVSITDNSRDYDEESTFDNGIASRNYWWKKTTDTSWTSGEPSTLPLNDNYLIKMIAKDNLGAESLPSYKYVSTVLDAGALAELEPIAEFNAFPTYIYTYDSEADKAVVYDTSYDPAGRSITERIWTVTKDGADQNMTPDGSGNIDFTGKEAGTYKISLQVKNSDNIISETVSRYVTVVVDTEAPTAVIDKAPGAYDDTTTMNINITDTGESGFNRRYIEVTSSTSTPETWGNLGTNPNFSLVFTEPSSINQYIHYKIVDNAGNETVSYFGPYTFKFNQSITFNSLPNKVYGDSPFYLSASSSTGLPLNYSSSDTDVATVDTNGLITIVGSGSTTITANQSGNAEYYPTSVQQNLTVEKRPITISAVSDTKVFDNNTDSTVTPVISSGSLVEGETGVWTQTFGTVNAGSGKTLTPTGTITDGSIERTNDYSITYVTEIGEITKATPVINVNDKTAIYNGNPVTIDPASVSGVEGADPSGDITYTYYTDVSCSTLTTPSNSGASSNGSAPIFAGTYYVKATIGSDTNYLEKTTEAPATLKIAEAEGGVLSIGSDITKTYGDTSFQITSSGGSGTGDVTYTSSNPSVASTTIDGYITINSVGTTTITATKAADTNYNAQTASININVNKKEVTYSITDNSKSYTGEPLYASVVPSISSLVKGTDYQITYTKAGEIVSEPREMGTYDISVVTLNNNYAGSKTGTFEITSVPQYELQISGLPENTIEYRDKFELAVNGGSGTGVITWESSDDNIATVTSSGSVEITGIGPVTIMAAKAADPNYDQQTAIVSFTAEKKSLTIRAHATNRDFIYGNTSVEVSLTTGIEGITADYTSATVLTDSADTSKVVTVSGVSLSGEGSNYYAPKSTTIYTTVDISPIDLPGLKIILNSNEVTSLNKTFGDSDFNLDIDSLGTGDVTWESSDVEVAKINSNTGVVTITGVGSCTITAYQDTDGDYNSAFKEISITVVPKNISYTVVNNTKVYTGDPQYATITPSDSKLVEGVDYIVTYKSSDTAVASPTDAGTYDITVETFNTNYTGSSTGAKLTIATADQNYTLQIGGLPNREIHYEDTFALYANGGNGTGDISWASSDDNIATVTTSGAIEITGIGKVTVTATKAADTNYNEQTSEITFTGVKKLINAAISGTVKTYSGYVQSVSLSGTDTNNYPLSKILDIEYTLQSDGSIADFKNAGLYNVMVSIGDEYVDKYIMADTLRATARINKVPLNVTAEVSDITYGDSEPNIYLSYESFLGNDTVSDLDDIGFILDTDYNTGNDVGTYSTTIEMGTANDDNYYFNSLNSSTFDVKNRSLIVKAVANSIEYGDSEPDVFIEYRGFKEGENQLVLDDTGFILGTNYEIGDDAGTYNTTIQLGTASDKNYNFVRATSNFQVEPRNIKIEADNKRKRLGTDDPELTYTITSGTLVNENDIDITVTREPGEEVGRYTLSASESTPNPNYDITFESGQMLIYEGSSSSSSSSSEVFPEVENGMIVKVIEDGEEDSVTAEETTSEGKKIITITTKEDSNETRAILTGDVVKEMELEDTTISVKKGKINYIIPAVELTIDKIAKELGVDEENLKDIEIEIEVSRLEEEQVEKINEEAQGKEYQLIVEPVEFKIKAVTIKEDSSIEGVNITNFSKYVSRKIQLSEDIDPEKITTGVVYNWDGNFSHIPTYVTEEEGKWYVVINSLTNSTYSIIWNPITVESVENHWSKDTVNDMASRIVIGNPEEFEPKGKITRAEFAEYITKAIGVYRTKITKEEQFTDLDIFNPKADAITAAVKYGIINGYPDGSFKPEQYISRAEAMVMYSRAMDVVGLMEIDNNRIENYQDKEDVPSWAYDNVKKTLSAGVFNGTRETTISPLSTFTYAEAAQAIKNLLTETNLID